MKLETGPVARHSQEEAWHKMAGASAPSLKLPPIPSMIWDMGCVLQVNRRLRTSLDPDETLSRPDQESGCVIDHQAVSVRWTDRTGCPAIMWRELPARGRRLLQFHRFDCFARRSDFTTVSTTRRGFRVWRTRLLAGALAIGNGIGGTGTVNSQEERAGISYTAQHFDYDIAVHRSDAGKLEFSPLWVIGVEQNDW
jgi:hypothetical protein